MFRVREVGKYNRKYDLIWVFQKFLSFRNLLWLLNLYESIIRVQDVENHDRKHDLIWKIQRSFSYHSYYNGLLDIIISVICSSPQCLWNFYSCTINELWSSSIESM